MAPKQPPNPPKATSSQRKRSPVIKRTVKISGKDTSVGAEDAFWTALKEIAKAKGITVSDLVSTINVERGQYRNLSSAIRVFVLEYYRGST